MRSKYAYRDEWYRDIIDTPSSYYIEPFQIAGNLFFVGTKDSASHVIDTGEGLILIDTGYPNMGGHLLHAIWKCGFVPEDIKIILHTHGHFDHFGNTAFIKKLTQGKTYMGKEDAKMMRDEPKLTLSSYFQGIPTEMFQPDVELEDGDHIVLGNTVVEAIHTPGHSQGAMTYRFKVQEKGKDYQATLCGGAGFNTLNKTFIEETGKDFRKEFKNSLELWKQMETDIFLGNHTPQSCVEEKRERKKREKENPFILPGEWKEYIGQLETEFYQMIEEEGSDPDFCKKISIKYPSSPINTGPGGFAILSYFHGVFSFGMKKVKFFWSYYGGSIPCSACLYDIYLGSVVKNRPLVLCILDNGTKIDKLLIKQNKEGFCVSTLLIYFFFVFASSCLMSPSVRIFFEKSIPVTFPISFNTSS